MLLLAVVLGLVVIEVEEEAEKLEEVEVEDEEEEEGNPPSEPKLPKLLPDEVEEAGEVACEDKAEPEPEAVAGGIDPNPKIGPPRPLTPGLPGYRLVVVTALLALAAEGAGGGCIPQPANVDSELGPPALPPEPPGCELD